MKKNKLLLLSWMFVYAFVAVNYSQEQPDFSSKNDFYVIFKSRLDAHIAQFESKSQTELAAKTNEKNTLLKNQSVFESRIAADRAILTELQQARRFMSPNDPNTVRYYNARIQQINNDGNQATQQLNQLKQRLTTVEAELNNIVNFQLRVIRANVRDFNLTVSFYNQWTDDKTEPSWKKLALLIAKISDERNLKTTVIVSFPPGSTVKCQNIINGQVQILQNSNAVLTPGFYQFWYERGGQPPVKRLVSVVSPQKSVVLN